MATTTAAICGAPAVFCNAVSASTSTAARTQLGAPALKFNSKPLGWTNKTVSNGSRVNAFNVLNPNTNIKYETLSYLPPLTDEQIVKQVDYLLRNGWIPAIEFDKAGVLSRVECKMPGYYEGRYWTMWKLPLFGATDSGQVLGEVQEAKKLYPESYIRVIGFDNVRQVQVVSFLVVKPEKP